MPRSFYIALNMRGRLRSFPLIVTFALGRIANQAETPLANATTAGAAASNKNQGRTEILRTRVGARLPNIDR